MKASSIIKYQELSGFPGHLQSPFDLPRASPFELRPIQDPCGLDQPCAEAQCLQVEGTVETWPDEKFRTKGNHGEPRIILACSVGIEFKCFYCSSLYENVDFEPEAFEIWARGSTSLEGIFKLFRSSSSNRVKPSPGTRDVHGNDDVLLTGDWLPKWGQLGHLEDTVWKNTSLIFSCLWQLFMRIAKFLGPLLIFWLDRIYHGRLALGLVLRCMDIAFPYRQNALGMSLNLLFFLAWTSTTKATIFMWKPGCRRFDP